MAINLKKMSANRELLAGGHRSCAGCSAPAVLRQALHVAGPGHRRRLRHRLHGSLHHDLSLHRVARARTSTARSRTPPPPSAASRPPTARCKRRGRFPEDKKINFIAFGGDGGTYDIGFQSLSGRDGARPQHALHLLRQQRLHEHRHPAVQRHAPRGRHQHQPQPARSIPGKQQQRKDLTACMIAHNIPYVAQASVSNHMDFMRKVDRGPWKSTARRSSTSSRPAIAAGDASRKIRSSWPAWPSRPATGRSSRSTTASGRSTTSPRSPCRSPTGSRLQGRFKHLLKDDREGILVWHQEQVDKAWDALVKREQESEAPSEK